MTTEHVAVAVPDVAVIVAEPYPTDVTRPVWSTVATEVLDDDHVTVCPAGMVVAVICVVSPILLNASEYLSILTIVRCVTYNSIPARFLSMETRPN